jgi:hypothetical protein
MTLTDPVSPDLRRHLRTLKLGQLLAVLPDRLTLARQQKLPHADFLELLLADEVTRRENGSAARRARAAGLDPQMRLDTWDATAAVRYDQQLWNELTSLRFADAEPVKLNETSGGWVCLWSLLGLDGRAGLVDPDLGGQPWCERALALEPDRAGGVGPVEDVLAAGLDGPGCAVVHRGGGVQADA